RFSPLTRSAHSGSTTHTNHSGSTAVASDRPSVPELPGSNPPPPKPAKPPPAPILKRVPTDQTSARFSTTSSASTRGDWEDGASHHTVSVAGDTESSLSEEGNKWSSSEYDVSGLSAAEIRKLRKKGINPALYAEMKAARKGKN
ncbi:hypothetical protein LTR53_019227, partial [Teratosphaeriaceae sp. CCFEE 6253]